jgi:hypothetical protein
MLAKRDKKEKKVMDIAAKWKMIKAGQIKFLRKRR